MRRTDDMEGTLKGSGKEDASLMAQNAFTRAVHWANGFLTVHLALLRQSQAEQPGITIWSISLLDPMIIPGEKLKSLEPSAAVLILQESLGLGAWGLDYLQRKHAH